jgi:hypothetical protein
MKPGTAALNRLLIADRLPFDAPEFRRTPVCQLRWNRRRAVKEA